MIVAAREVHKQPSKILKKKKKKKMESVHRISHRLFPISISEKCFFPRNYFSVACSISGFPRNHKYPYNFGVAEGSSFITSRTTSSRSRSARAGWFLGMGDKKSLLPDIVKAGDPVLHEPAQDVSVKEIGSPKIQSIIDDMIKVMRKAPGVGLAAPQIGIPLKVLFIFRSQLIVQVFYIFFFFFLCRLLFWKIQKNILVMLQRKWHKHKIDAHLISW